MANGELKRYINQWQTLLWADTREVSYELSACRWDDSVGGRIKEKIEETVEAYLREGLDLYGSDLLSIELSELEDALYRAEMHLSHPDSRL